MIKRLARWILKSELDRKQKQNDELNSRYQEVMAENYAYRDRMNEVDLELKVARMYADDDEALVELYDTLEKIDIKKKELESLAASIQSNRYSAQDALRRQQGSAMYGSAGLYQGSQMLDLLGQNRGFH